jgi:aconitate hydratase
LKVGDNISTDEISPAGARALPYRSNIPKLAMFSFTQVDESYPERALAAKETGHIVVGGDNYGQGSSREHAAIALRHLGLRVVIAKSFARIHWQNLANFGVLALEFIDAADYDDIAQDDTLALTQLHAALDGTDPITIENTTKKTSLKVRHRLSPRQAAYVLAGGLIPQLSR